jgi:hypothetical protein
VSLDVGGPVELLKWRSASTLEAAPMWVSPTHCNIVLTPYGYNLTTHGHHNRVLIPLG